MARDVRSNPLRSTGDGGENPRSHMDRDMAYGRVPQAPQDPDVKNSRLFGDVCDENGPATYGQIGNVGDGSGKFQFADIDSIRETNIIPYGETVNFKPSERITVNVDHAPPGDRFGNNDANRRSEPSSYIKSLIDAQADESTDSDQV